MSIELAEKLKVKLTDKWVVVDGSVAELKRFAEWTGKVKSVNMNCRALVEFDGPVDIGWYDIDPAFLTVVDGPRPKKVAEQKPAEAKKPAASPAPATAGSSSTAAPAAAGGKPSPLDMIRKMGAAKKEAAPDSGAAATTEVAAEAPAVAEPAPAAKPAPVSSTDESGRKLSPMEMIRKMGAAKRE